MSQESTRNTGVEKALTKTLKPVKERKENEPMVLFPSILGLDREKETAMIDWCMRRMDELKDENGLTSAVDGWMSDVGDAQNAVSKVQTWIGKRDIYDALYNNDVEWRRICRGGIWEHSNLVLPISRRYIQQQFSRANNYFFSTEPWCAIAAVGRKDQPFATLLNEFGRFKMDRAGLRDQLESAVETAFVMGEAVLKTVHRVEASYYQTIAEVMVDRQTGEPVQTPNGEYVFPSDRFIDVDGIMVMEADQRVVLPEAHAFEKRKISRRIKKYNGPDTSAVPYRNFLCPLDSKTVQDADCVVHLYRMPVAEMAEMYLDATEGSAENRLRGLSDIVNAIGPETIIRERKVNEDHDIENNGAEPMIDLAEFHFRFDADGDGVMEDLTMVLNLGNKQPLYYDYTANVTPDGKRPFSVVRVNPVPGKWYGRGTMEIMMPVQDIIDLTINRWNFSQTTEGAVTFWDSSAVEEGQADADLELNTGRTYTLKPGKKAEDALQVVHLVNYKDQNLAQFLEVYLQMASNMSGVSQVNDANMAGMDTSKLATGVRNMEKSGQELFGAFLSHLSPGIRDAVEKFLRVLVKNMDEREAFEYTEGEQEVIADIGPEDVANLDLNVRLEMTRYKGEQDLVQGMQAAKAATEFYNLMPQVQERLAPLYRQQLRAFQVRDVDEIIQPMPLIEQEPPRRNADDAREAVSTGKPTGQAQPLV